MLCTNPLGKFLTISVLIKRIKFFSNVIKYSLSSVKILFGQRSSLIYPRTITILPYATSTTPSLHVRIWQDGDYHKVLIAPLALILNHYFMLSLVVNSTLIALPGDTTQSLTSLPYHFNP